MLETGNAKMAPGLSTNNNSNLEETIAKVYETLKRTEHRTLETKQRAAKTLECSSHHLSKAKHFPLNGLSSNRFSQSLDYTSCKGKQERDSLALQRISTIDNGRTPNRVQARRTSLTCMRNESVKKSTVNNTKLRTIIFNTLDKLFQLPAKPSPKRTSPTSHQSLQDTCGDENSCLSLETLKFLNQNAADTLPRDHSLLRHENQGLLVGKGEENEFANGESSSDDDSCWEFITTPLKIEEVTLEDTLELSVSKTHECDPMSVQEIRHPPQKIHYQQNRKSKKGTDKSKIKKRAEERQIEKIRNEMLKLEEIRNTEPIINAEGKANKVRPDSPTLMRKVVEKRTSVTSSLPNLMEAVLELDISPSSTISDCGPDTFTRNISYCPSSTLANINISSFAENHENDDDACSTTSSFSSLQRMPCYNNSTMRSTHESTLPIPSAESALCKGVLVSPINVPIEPFIPKGNEVGIRGITSQTFQELSEVYIPNIPVDEGEGNKCAVQKVIHRNNKIFESTSSSSETESTTVSTPPSSEDSDTIQVDVTVQESAITVERATTSSSSISFQPAPPPIPPPLPPPVAANTIRGLLPLSIITQRQEGNCIFNEMKDIQIEKGIEKELKEKFPLKSAGKALKRLIGRGKGHELAPEEKKFLRNIELFLRTRVSNDRATETIENVVRSIMALDVENSEVETEWFAILAQFLPKADEVDKIVRNKNLQRFGTTPAGLFVSKLLSIKNLHGKLTCIQFSLDFNDGSSKLSKWSKSFIEACGAIEKSDKFVSIINVIMGLLQSLNPDEQARIYGFDIQGLTRLATRTSEDGATTFLQFVIEYILSKPDLIASVDFYKTFKDLPDVTKTSIKEMRAQCAEWKRNLLTYKAQVEHILKHDQIPSSELQYATTFQDATEKKLIQLDEKLSSAQQSFNSCKERFGLLHGETTEVMFFESLSKFVMAYQKTYNEIMEQKEKASKQNAGNGNRRMSFYLPNNSDNGTSPSDIIKARRKSCTATEIRGMMSSVDNQGQCEAKKQPTKLNSRRQSCSSREAQVQEVINAPTTAEVGKSLFNLLSRNDNGQGKRLRKRASNSPSKLPIRT